MNIKSETYLKLLRYIRANKTVVVILVTGVLFLSSCASPPSEILPAYVSPLQYEQYDCSQIGSEMERVTRELNQIYAAVKKKSSNDATAMGVGMILFWPSLFLIRGDGSEATQFAQLQGELEALEKASILKKCDKGMLPEIPEFRKNSSVFTNEDSNEILKIGKKEYKLPNVFHRYECKHRNEDFLEYRSAKEAQDAGGRPCKLCNPKDMTINQERIKKGR